MSIKEIVKGTTAKFVEYRKGNLWYCIHYSEMLPEEDGLLSKNHTQFNFPVPIEEVGDGIFKAEHKSMELMRYVRIHLKAME